MKFAETVIDSFKSFVADGVKVNGTTVSTLESFLDEYPTDCEETWSNFKNANGANSLDVSIEDYLYDEYLLIDYYENEAINKFLDEDRAGFLEDLATMPESERVRFVDFVEADLSEERAKEVITFLAKTYVETL